MVRTGDNLATGFLGPVKGWGGLVPSARSARILPEQLDLWRTDAAADQALDLVEVRALTESMGRVEDAFADFAARLRSAGTLLVDVDNLQSARMLRMVVEGRPGAFDPSGSPQDPNQALPLRRVLAAAAANGLLVRDVLRVPSGAQEFGCDLAPRLFGAGMMPLDWLTGTPPARFWLHCEKVTSRAIMQRVILGARPAHGGDCGGRTPGAVAGAAGCATSVDDSADQRSTSASVSCSKLSGCSTGGGGDGIEASTPKAAGSLLSSSIA